MHRYLVAGLSLSLLVFLLCTFINAQVPQSPVAVTSAQPAEPVPSFTAQLKKSIIGIKTTCVENGTRKSYIGTGFLTSVASEDKKLQFSYLVTNRHVVQPGIEHGHPCQVGGYDLEANTISPTGPLGVYLLQSPLISPHWTFSSDDSVDLAVTPIGLNRQNLDFKLIPSNLFATKDVLHKSNISEGHTVIFSGVFVQFPGEKRLEPVVRQGILAMMPEEKIMTTLGYPGELYLADIHVFGGNSGSPMFIDLAGDQGGSFVAGTQFLLLGVVSGYEYEASDFTIQAATTYSGTLGTNSGIATIVPCDKLLDILNSTELKGQRLLQETSVKR